MAMSAEDNRLYIKGLIKEFPDVWINAYVDNGEINMQFTNITHTSAGEGLSYFAPILWGDKITATNTTTRQTMYFYPAENADINGDSDLVFYYDGNELLWKSHETFCDFINEEMDLDIYDPLRIKGYAHADDSFMYRGITIYPYNEYHPGGFITFTTDSVTELPVYLNPRLIPCENSEIVAQTGIKSIASDSNNSNIYDINGNIHTEKNLPSGIYIRNKKKFVVK